MLIKVAWRNIWRNKVRSLVVIIALALGLWAGLFTTAFVNGMMQQRVNSIVSHELSHVQFHHPSFREEMLLKYTLLHSGTIRQQLRYDKNVKAIAARTIHQCMLGSANMSGGIKVNGIDPEEEKQIRNLHKMVKQGEYFTGVKQNPVLISAQTAKKYKLEIGSKLVITLQDVNGEITAGAFRVAGIFDSGNKLFDQSNLFALRHEMQELSGMKQNIHEMAVLLKTHEQADAFAQKYQQQFMDLEILSWKDLASGMRYMMETMDMYGLIIIGIILLALMFSIINTMLMAVLDRIREIGMLMAVGMSRGRVFRMIMMETVFLAMAGVPIGLLVSYASITYFGDEGIHLAGAAYGDFGFSNLIYPSLNNIEYVRVCFMVLSMSLLAAIYPARKALKLNPVEAIRKI